MALWPAVKMTDMVIGVDFHTTLIPPSPSPVPMVPHPYFGCIFLWMTPAFAKVDTLINGMPACTSGSMGYSVHIPQLAPVPPLDVELMLLEALPDQHSQSTRAGRADVDGEHGHCRHLFTVCAARLGNGQVC